MPKTSATIGDLPEISLAPAEVVRGSARDAFMDCPEDCDRYRRMFVGSSIAIWEQDWSAVRRRFSDLTSGGSADLGKMLSRDFDLVRSARGLIKIVAANPAAHHLLGACDFDQMAREPTRSLPVSDVTAREAFLAYARHDQGFEAEGSVRTFSGARLGVLFSIAFTGPNDLVLVNMVDVSRRKDAEQALLDARYALAHASRTATMNALTASITHELSQPLAAVIANAEASSRWLRQGDVTEATASVERILESGHSASAIVRRTRSFLGGSGIVFERVAITDVLTEAVALLERELAVHGVSLIQIVAPDLPEVRADRIRLQQVVVNLVMNAIEAMICEGREDRTLILSANRNDPGRITVLIADNGSGISTEHMEHLYEPLFTTKERGMGLGLAICRTAVEAHGGRIWATSEPGVGSIFHFTVPINRS